LRIRKWTVSDNIFRTQNLHVCARCDDTVLVADIVLIEDADTAHDLNVEIGNLVCERCYGC
jgi:hypothetical protein